MKRRFVDAAYSPPKNDWIHWIFEVEATSLAGIDHLVTMYWEFADWPFRHWTIPFHNTKTGRKTLPSGQVVYC